MAVELRKFDIQRLYFAQGTKPVSVGIIGRPRSGKTTLVRDLLRLNSDVAASNCHVFICPDSVPDDDDIADRLRRQTARIQLATQQPGEVDARAILAFDGQPLGITAVSYSVDETDDEEEEVEADVTNKSIIYWAINARHLQTMPIIASQSVQFIPSAVCNNFDYVFLQRENILPSLRKLYELFGGMFPTFEQFCETLNHYTDDNQFLVICHRPELHTGNPEDPGALSPVFDFYKDLVFWYKAEV